MRVLFIHPEGNVNNNPNLLAILKLCHQEGCVVDVLSESKGFMYQHGRDYFRLHLVQDMACLIRHRNSEFYNSYFLEKLFTKIGRAYDLIIGVDREGLLIGASISRLTDTPLVLISYEILFAEEVGDDNKQEERVASREVCYAICQDEMRAGKLADENGIPLEKILCLPVSARDSEQPCSRSNWLRDRYGISSDKKIALYMGSLASWAGFDLLVDDLKNWPEDWVLVLHGRFKGKWQFKKLERLSEKVRQKVVISKQPFERYEDLHILPRSADLGIALYCPDWTDPMTGNNLKYLGWASGKVCTYLQTGLPVLVNEIGGIAEACRAEDFGYVLSGGKRLSALLDTISREDLDRKSRNARDYFVEYLDFDKHSHKLIKMIESISSNSFHQEQIDCDVLKREINSFYFLSFGPFYDFSRRVKKNWRKLSKRVHG